MREVNARVEEDEQKSGDEDEAAVEDEEARLVLHDFVAPAAGHFSDTVDASDQDDKVRNGDGISEFLKVAVVPKLPSICVLGLRKSHVLPHSNIVIRAEDSKGDEHDNLQRNTSNNGTVSRLGQLRIGVAASSGDTSTDSLDDEAAQVGGEEDDGIPAGLDARNRGVEVDGDVLEGEVDGNADEGWCEDDGADLQLESAAIPGVGVELDATNVAKHFQQQADGQANGICICLLPYSQTNRTDCQDAKDNGEKDA